MKLLEALAEYGSQPIWRAVWDLGNQRGYALCHRENGQLKLRLSRRGHAYVGWNPTVEDLTAEDWCLAPPSDPYVWKPPPPKPKRRGR